MDGDFLYILGDVVDRNGDGGVEMLCWLLEQSNVQLILGNHEAMLLSCAFVFEEITNESLQNVTSEKLELLNLSLIHIFLVVTGKPCIQSSNSFI